MIEIPLPWPDRRLSPNARLHWAALARAKREARNVAIVATWRHARGQSLSGDGPLRVTLRFLPPDRRARDWDNLLASMKAGLDGIAQALGVDDKRFRLALELGEPLPPGEVRVQIQEMTDG